MIHVHAMRQLVHHDHLYGPKTEPLARARGFEDELDDFSSVEVAADEFRVGFVFFEGGDGEVGGCHDGFTYCGDAGEEVLGEGGGRAWERFDEYDAIVWVGLVRIEALDAEGHSCVLGLEAPWTRLAVRGRSFVVKLTGRESQELKSKNRDLNHE